MTIKVIFPSGGIEITQRDTFGNLIKEIYIGYSKKEAIAKFELLLAQRRRSFDR